MIARLEGKWKLGQNRSREDQASVEAELRRRQNPLAAVMAISAERRREG